MGFYARVYFAFHFSRAAMAQNWFSITKFIIEYRARGDRKSVVLFGESDASSSIIINFLPAVPKFRVRCFDGVEISSGERRMRQPSNDGYVTVYGCENTVASSLERPRSNVNIDGVLQYLLGQ